MHHCDPFDRMLVAQAIVEGLLLATRDSDIPRYDVDTLIV
jgi:PIN domain nuclease of toxin-antitoxin system